MVEIHYLYFNWRLVGLAGAHGS